MSAERWRCFVAVPIGEDLRADLSDAIGVWPVLDGLRWTDPEAWHVTLAFLGSVEAGLVPELADRVKAVAARHAPMRLATGGLGAFPSPARARVALYGVDDADGRMAQLAADVARALGPEPAQPYRPHLTLARARRGPVDLRSWLASVSAPGGRLILDRIELMRSHTGKDPPRYETLAAIAMGGVAARV
jgi:RNA 2',3'-cyclic 3'-phosphodiesterase